MIFQSTGVKSRRVIVLELLVAANVNEVVSYRELAHALTLDESGNRNLIQTSVNQAKRELLIKHDRAVVAVPNRGYRIVQADEHVDLAKAQQKRSSKALVRGKHTVEHVDFNNMSTEGRALAETMVRLFGAQIDFNKRSDVRQRDLENALKEVREVQDETKGQVGDLAERLRVVEERLAQAAPSAEAAPSE